MDRATSQSSNYSPNLIEVEPFDFDRLLSHIDPGPAEESEAFVRRIYEQRGLDAPSERDHQTGD